MPSSGAINFPSTHQRTAEQRSQGQKGEGPEPGPLSAAAEEPMTLCLCSLHHKATGHACLMFRSAIRHERHGCHFALDLEICGVSWPDRSAPTCLESAQDHTACAVRARVILRHTGRRSADFTDARSRHRNDFDFGCESSMGSSLSISAKRLFGHCSDDLKSLTP